MAGFVEVLGFGPMEQKTLAATFALSLRRELVYAKWRPGQLQLPSIILFDGNNPDVLREVIGRAPNPAMPLVAVALQAPDNVPCIHVERPIRFLLLLEALDRAMAAGADARHAATLPLVLQKVSKPTPVMQATPPQISAAQTQSAVPLAQPVDEVSVAGKIGPLSSSAEQPALVRVSGQTLSTNQRAVWVLVVDDDIAVRRFMSSQLAPFNVNVDYAASGEQAVGLTGSKHYACVFLDVVMPGMDGYQVCKLIKSKRSGGEIRVVMLTSRSGTFDRIRGKMSGCDAYLTKPVDKEKLVTTLMRVLGGKLTSASAAAAAAAAAATVQPINLQLALPAA